ncbi:MAG: hydantoinase/oxoprolinase family protein [Chloroflexi bacterium]|nr:hydantoinase/oxoprolinase family protein [Chloroflexota bacterium]
MRLGIDVGGTFTDLVLIDDKTGNIHFTKTLTTPKDLAQGVMNGIEKILKISNSSSDDLEYIAHGTTIGTNALIERKGAKVGLITTAGFRDILEIARIERPDAGLYDIFVDLPEPLVPRYLRLEAEERIGADGEIVKPLDDNSVINTVEKFKKEGVEAIAVCLLFSFRNSTHENRVREICQEVFPQADVTISSEIAPEFREFERTSTTVINAYLLPVTRQYIKSLQDRLGEKFGEMDLRIMQASGGAMTAEVAKSHAVHMVNSGPAGGALATGLFGRLAGEDSIISMDMGGTSFDVGLIVNGQPRIKSEGEFEGYPVKIPMIDVEGFGAGGGSIAWVDAGGALNVGPQSAGADPGPACYGNGGELPTVTDANLVLGRLNPDYFLGSEMKLSRNLAEDAIRSFVAEPLNLSVEDAAAGIIRVVNANMVRGISANSTQSGYDVREFSLLAFGGAGPLHAVELAEETGISRVIIPPYCAVFSAFGGVVSDIRHDYVQTIAYSQSDATPEKLQAHFDELAAQADQLFKNENVSPGSVHLERLIDLRYEGQSYELTIPIKNIGKLEQKDIDKIIADFHSLHKRIYAYGDPSELVEFISLRLVGIGQVPKIELLKEDSKETSAPLQKAERRVYFPGSGFVETKIFEREDLSPGMSFNGPSLVEETTSTSVIPPEWTAKVDVYTNLVVSRN